jgi:hypothetical protein
LFFTIFTNFLATGLLSDAANAAAYVTPLAADPAFVGISTFEPIEAVTL